MKPSIRSLGEILYSPSQYLIPVFQRNYRWDREQWAKLWASLMEIRRPDKTGRHFMGFLVFVPGLPMPGHHNRFHLIDGQQRLTTCSILLAAIRNVARAHGAEELAEEIHADYLTHPRKRGEDRYRLLPKEQDQEQFAALVDGEDTAGRMADALDFFEDAVEQSAASEQQLRALLNLLLQRLEFMCATLEVENAYNIFKSLNSTGVPLGQADLIRNFVFMHVPPDDQDRFDRELWRPLEAQFSRMDGRLDDDRFSRFFRDVLMMDGRYVQPSQTFAEFEQRYEATAFSPWDLARTLREAASDYAVITGAATDANRDLSLALGNLNLLESSTTYPLLLSLFRKRRTAVIDDDALLRCVEMLRGFILRRFICGDSSRGYGQTFVRALQPEETNPVATVERYLLQRGWPDDRRFTEAFASFPLYRRGYAKEVLQALEQRRGHKEPADLVKAQIEHIMPQTLTTEWRAHLGSECERVHDEWLHRPGNLTLSAYNQELGNQPFAAKRQRFADSNVGLTRDLASLERWGEDTMRARGEQMASEAASIWVGPKEPYSVGSISSDASDEAPARVLRGRFWSALADYLSDSHPDLPGLESRPTRTLRLSSGIRHVGFELRFMVRPGAVAIEVWFWREASFPVWQRLRDDPAAINELVGDTWTFEQVADGGTKGWMTISLSADCEDENTWPQLHAWFGERLERLYQHVAPELRNAMAELAPPRDAENDDQPDSPTRERQHRFWKALVATLGESAPTIRAQTPRPQHWLNISIGRAGFGLIPTASVRHDRLGVEIFITGADAKRRFAALLNHKDRLEAQLGFPLDWQELPGATACRVVVYKLASPLADEARWPEYLDWMVTHVQALDNVFRPAVRNIPDEEASLSA